MKIGSLRVLRRDANELLSLLPIFFVGKVLYKTCTHTHSAVSIGEFRDNPLGEVNEITLTGVP